MWELAPHKADRFVGFVKSTFFTKLLMSGYCAPEEEDRDATAEIRRVKTFLSNSVVISKAGL
jgi:hypothetical protein